MISKNDFDDFETLKNNKIKNAIRAFEIEIKIFFYKLMYDIKTFDNVKIRTETNKNFQKFIICYNNVFFFAMN